MRKYLILFLTLILFYSCENDTSSPNDPGPTQMGLDGVVQKGPFNTGTKIIVQELNDEFSPNGTSFNVTTEDNFGSFSLNSEVSTDFIEIISEGFYFNEVIGVNTDTELTLRALSGVSDSLKCNINILTTLAKKRIVYLINEEDKTYNKAKQQAQDEILEIFSIYEADVDDFEKMDISQNKISDAILLAISVVLQGSNSVSELSLLISTIIEDIKEDGILNDSGSNLEIYDNAKGMILPDVRNNIETRYDDLGLTLTVPDFEKYVNDMWKKQCTIISPLNNQTFNYNDSMTVNIDEFASYINIVNAKYYLDGDLFSEDNEYPFVGGMKLHNLDFGNHLLKTVATDDSSNVYDDSINVIVNTPDDFTIVSPYNNASFNLNDSIYINISSQPDFLEVTNVKYYFDDTLISELTNEPYTFNYLLNSIDMCGVRQVKSEVTDETGRITYDFVNINVITPAEFSIVSPANNTFFNLNDPIYINISSQPEYLEVTNVKYYFDDELLAELTQYSFNSVFVRDSIVDCGNRFIKAEITDETGRVSRDSVNIVINTPDQFTLISPSDNLVLAAGDTITIDISDQPDYLEVVNVEYYFNNEFISQISTYPHEYIYTLSDSIEAGSYYVKAVITDESGNVSKDSSLVIIPGMVYVQGGTYDMGDHFAEGEANELPVHSVTVSDFYIGKYEVTQFEWETYMFQYTFIPDGNADSYPAYDVSWYIVVKYCNLRSIEEGLEPCYSINGSTNPSDWGVMPYYVPYTGSVEGDQAAWDAAICNWSANGYRLPTEAEWEYAARGGIWNSDNYRYSGSNILDDVAWYRDNSDGICHSVGTKQPNQLGIYDMTGNVNEWCWDWYSSNYYSNSSTVDPLGPTTTEHRMGRGGSRNPNTGLGLERSRLSFRWYAYPELSYAKELQCMGFRVVRRP
ncbi:MAG: SUMF1/EgtB/PvdO family nonheme iron enzyme [Candidatus Delongbacteria bacterium]|jgi:formylglycine-generating enzyme required for sulfatase activity|nr:SUMF1/EgtB/PvdO family nonheme iron enzyme [Candidatus Delongbacteria bacterium]